MNGLKHFFEFGTDLLLISFLMVLMGVVFISAVNLTPGGTDFSVKSDVLGTSTALSGDGLEIAPQIGNDQNIDLSVQSHEDNQIKLAFTTSDLSNGEHVKKMAVVTNAGVKSTKIYFRLDLAEKYLSDMRYDLVAGGTNYVVYDDNDEKLTRDFEIAVEPGQTFELLLKVTAYKTPAYSIKGVAIISSELKTLP